MRHRVAGHPRREEAGVVAAGFRDRSHPVGDVLERGTVQSGVDFSEHRGQRGTLAQQTLPASFRRFGR